MRKPAQFGQTTMARLTKAGWFPGRQVDISTVEEKYAVCEISQTCGVREFLREFYGLRIRVPERLLNSCSLDAWISVGPETLAAFCLPKAQNDLRELIGERACPIALDSAGFGVFMTLTGKIVLLDRDWTMFFRVADNYVEALEILCGGRFGSIPGVPLDENRRPLGAPRLPPF